MPTSPLLLGWFDGPYSTLARARWAAVQCALYGAFPLMPMLIGGDGWSPRPGLPLLAWAVLVLAAPACAAIGRRRANAALRALEPRAPQHLQQVAAGEQLLRWVQSQGLWACAPLVPLTLVSAFVPGDAVRAAVVGVLASATALVLSWPTPARRVRLGQALEADGARFELSVFLDEHAPADTMAPWPKPGSTRATPTIR